MNIPRNNKIKMVIGGKEVLMTDKKLKLLGVLCDKRYKKDTLTSKLKKAGITHQYYYQLMEDSDFLKLMKLRNIASLVNHSHHIVNSVIDKAMDGNYMQQRLALELSGDYSQTPLVNILINNNQRPLEDTDKQIISKIIDMMPDKSDDNTDNTDNNKNNNDK